MASTFSWLLFLNNSILLGSSIITGRRLSLNHPFATAACIVGGSIAILGIFSAIFVNWNGGNSSHKANNSIDDCHRLRDVAIGVLELLPVTLVNMELYVMSQGQLWPIAMGHALFVLPVVAMDVCCSLSCRRNQCEIAATSKTLALIGNRVTMAFLAVIEGNSLYARMAIYLTMRKLSGLLMDSLHEYEEVHENLLILGTAYFFYQLAELPTVYMQSPQPIVRFMYYPPNL